MTEHSRRFRLRSLTDAEIEAFRPLLDETSPPAGAEPMELLDWAVSEFERAIEDFPTFRARDRETQATLDI